MVKKLGFLFLAVLFSATLAKGQLADKATFFGGFNYQFISMTPQGSPAPTRFPFYGFGAGMNYTLLHSNDQFSLGLNPNANFSFVFSSLFGLSTTAQAPVFLLARYGSSSTPYNEQKFGLGAGIGAAYTWMLLRQSFVDQFGVVQNVRLQEGWINPTAIVELNLKTRFSDYIFRFQWSLARPTREIEEFDGFPFRMGAAGLSIMYTF